MKNMFNWEDYYKKEHEICRLRRIKKWRPYNAYICPECMNEHSALAMKKWWCWIVELFPNCIARLFDGFTKPVIL